MNSTINKRNEIKTALGCLTRCRKILKFSIHSWQKAWAIWNEMGAFSTSTPWSKRQPPAASPPRGQGRPCVVLQIRPARTTGLLGEAKELGVGDRKGSRCRCSLTDFKLSIITTRNENLWTHLENLCTCGSLFPSFQSYKVKLNAYLTGRLAATRNRCLKQRLTVVLNRFDAI
jgi:hypothetical protein